MCNNLTEVKVEMASPVAITSGVFSNRANATLYVPIGSKPEYEVADYWKEFGTIVDGDYPITFADANVNALCVANWDTSGDGQLSYAEAAAVTDLGRVFNDNQTITSFDELQYFTGLQSISEDAFLACTDLISIKIPNLVTTIGEYAFACCSGLTSINIPNSVTTIGAGAFYDCDNLTNINIPNSVTTIGYMAFYGCKNLTVVKVAMTSPVAITSDDFSNRRNATLYVPFGSKPDYEAADYWKEFKQIIEFNPSAPSEVDITIGSAKAGTYCSPYPLDFTGSSLKAYIASGFGQNSVMMTRVYKVPAGEGIIIRGNAGTYTIPVEYDCSICYANLLIGLVDQTVVQPTEGNYTNMSLGYQDNKLGFYPFLNAGSIGPNRAYLQVKSSTLASVSGAKQYLAIVFDDEDMEATGIDSTFDKSRFNDGKWYNLQGVPLPGEPTEKGIYIHNGKKVVK